MVVLYVTKWPFIVLMGVQEQSNEIRLMLLRVFEALCLLDTKIITLLKVCARHHQLIGFDCVCDKDSNLTRDLALLLTHVPAQELEKQVAVQASQLFTLVLSLDSGIQVTHLGLFNLT